MPFSFRPLTPPAPFSLSFLTESETRDHVGTAAPGCPAERSSAALSPFVLFAKDGATTRGPGSKDASPRPSARRFSIFSFSPEVPADAPATFAVVEVVIRPSLDFIALTFSPAIPGNQNS